MSPETTIFEAEEFFSDNPQGTFHAINVKGEEKECKTLIEAEEFLKIDASPTSPQQAGPILLNFFDALREVEKGSKITRIEWKNDKIYGFMQDKVLALHQANDVVNSWVISDGDMDGEDWKIVT